MNIKSRSICNTFANLLNSNLRDIVVLNPVANKKKCEKQFQRYCEPILHLAGYSVEIIKTQNIGDAKSIMETLQILPDIVVVAGGDGTASEVVTGLIRRNENVCPILFLPLGEKNKTALSLMRLTDKSEFVKNVSECMLALFLGCIEYRPVIKCELIENVYPESSKPIFGIRAFSWGLLKDIEINSAKYWYFGTFKYHTSIVIALLSNKLNKSFLANILHTPACPGCDKCEVLIRSKCWFNAPTLLHSQLLNQTGNGHKERKQHSAEKYEITAKQIDITCEKHSDSFFSLNTHIIENIPLQTEVLINLVRRKNIHSSSAFKSYSMEIIPLQAEHQTYYIDGEAYDARHIKISVLPHALKYFYKSWY